MTLRTLHKLVGSFPFIAFNKVTNSVVVLTERANVTGEYLKTKDGELHCSDLNQWDLVTVESKS